MSDKRQCSKCGKHQLERYRTDIGTRGVRYSYRCLSCGAEASHGTVGNAAVGLVAGLVLIPVLAFMVQGYSVQDAPKGVFVAAAVLVGLAIWELVALYRFRQAHPPALEAAG